jgi:hypothetical protein
MGARSAQFRRGNEKPPTIASQGVFELGQVQLPAGGSVEASCRVPFLITGQIPPPIAIVPSSG